MAGDLRGEGAKILMRLWDAIGWPEERKGELQSGSTQRMGGYQIQFVPGLVEDVLSLCLSHHDDLRSSAVHVLYSMIVGEVRPLLLGPLDFLTPTCCSTTSTTTSASSKQKLSTASTSSS